MKKLLGIVISLLICATTVFALDLKVDANFILPIESWSEKDEGENFISKTNYSEVAPGIDVTGTYMFTKEWGARLSVSYFFPASYTQEEILTYKNANHKAINKYRYSFKDAYSNGVVNSIIVFNINPSAVYTFINKKKYSVSADLGFIYQKYTTRFTYDTDEKITFSSQNFGLTAGVFGTYEFMSNIYATAAVDLGWIMYTQGDDGKSTGIHRFYFAPKIGVGYKF